MNRNKTAFLFTPVDNAALVLFRIIFGILMSWFSFEAIASGWVRRNYILPKFTFSHIGMEWLQPLPGNGMYYYFSLMGLLGIMIILGFYYRWSIGIFTLLFAGVYFMQKTVYNNHYYLVMLICLILFFLPAANDVSIDSQRDKSKRTTLMPAWCLWVMIAQVTIVYFFATVAKFYGGWLDGTFASHMLDVNSNETVAFLYSQKWFGLFIAYTGLLFDLLVIPLLLWRKTRIYAFIASLIFHLFNKYNLDIGIFPFLALSFTLFFFPGTTLRKIFLPKFKPTLNFPEADHQKNILTWFFIPYFIIQLALPVRHWFIKGDVLWTEEGHRLSWRMMLRNRDGYCRFIVVDHVTNQQKIFKLKRLLTKKQKKEMQTKPDMIWQTAQKIKEYYHNKGKEVSIYVDSKVSINDLPAKRFIDPNVDFAKAQWNYFSHNNWILLYE